jgi:penicillin G amidase
VDEVQTPPERPDAGARTPDPETAERVSPQQTNPEKSKRYRRLRIVAAVLAFALVVCGGAATWYAYQTVHAAFPQVSGTLRLDGLNSRVEVNRDERGIPQVYAGTAHDLFYAQGYVQAQDRFWQMDVYRHTTAGSLSDMFGPGQIGTDTFIRTLGWRRAAQRNYDGLSPATKEYLAAYTAGVNAYLSGRSGAALGLEYQLLSFQVPYRPHRWTALDSVAWLMALAWDLRNNVQQEIDRSLAAGKLSPRQVDELYPPDQLDAHPPIVSQDAAASGGAAKGKPASAPDLPEGVRTQLSHVTELIRSMPAATLPVNDGAGSNSWVVSGRYTTTGKPLLANDPHLGPELPSIWYQMGLHCTRTGPDCPYNVTGFTIPGMPGVLIGHNDRVAWGFTNGAVDVADLYLEKVRGNSYLYEGRWYPLEEHKETITVAGQKPVTVTVRATRHGPLVSDANDDLRKVGASAPVPASERAAPLGGGSGYAVAVRWTALNPNRTMDSLFELDKARNWAEFRSAAADFSVPPQNMVYADVDGNIGYQVAGQVPIRKKGDGAWPVPGWSGAYEWTGYIPFGKLPYAYNPPAGYIVTANNTIIGPPYPYLLSKDPDYGYRSTEILRQLRQATKNGRKISPADMSRIQNDEYNPIAASLVPYLTKLKVNDSTAKAQDLLRGWDFTQSATSAPAAYFNQVWALVLRYAFASRLPKNVLVDGGSRWFAVVQKLLPDADSAWWDDPDTTRRENRDQLLTRAMEEAAAQLGRAYGTNPKAWRWGTMHTLTPTNQTLGTAGPGLVKWLLNGRPLPVGGGTAIVDATGYNAEKGFAVTMVPSMRMVVDVSAFDRSTWINLTGASGHAFHPNYLDQAPLWQQGRTLPWSYSRTAVLAATKHSLVLLPRHT